MIQTRPKEKTEFVEAIQSDIEWLGADWEGRLFFASDYFEQMYEGAVKLIKREKLTYQTFPQNRSVNTEEL